MMPSTIVMRMLRSCFPGTNSRAIAPAISPMMMRPISVPSIWFLLCWSRRLLLDGVLDLLAGLLQVALGLVDLALVLQAPVTGRLADALLDLAAEFLGLVLRLIFGAHLPSPSDQGRPGATGRRPATANVVNRSIASRSVSSGRAPAGEPLSCWRDSRATRTIAVSGNSPSNCRNNLS